VSPQFGLCKNDFGRISFKKRNQIITKRENGTNGKSGTNGKNAVSEADCQALALNAARA
jgi:hypothetical protein